MFLNKTNQTGSTCINFPRMLFRRQWISFVRPKREPDSWRPGSGHICSDHFMTEDYHGYGVKLAGFAGDKNVAKEGSMPFRRSKLFQLQSSSQPHVARSANSPHLTKGVSQLPLSNTLPPKDQEDASRVCTLCNNIEMVLSPFECVTR